MNTEQHVDRSFEVKLVRQKQDSAATNNHRDTHAASRGLLARGWLLSLYGHTYLFSFISFITFADNIAIYKADTVIVG